MSTTPLELALATTALLADWDSLTGESQPGDMQTIVDGFNKLRPVVLDFFPEQWAYEGKTQAAIGVYALRVTQEVERAQRAEAALEAIRKIGWKNSELNVHAIGDCERAFEEIVDVLNQAARPNP